MGTDQKLRSGSENMFGDHPENALWNPTSPTRPRLDSKLTEEKRITVPIVSTWWWPMSLSAYKESFKSKTKKPTEITTRVPSIMELEAVEWPIVEGWMVAPQKIHPHSTHPYSARTPTMFSLSRFFYLFVCFVLFLTRPILVFNHWTWWNL